jgi:hypothetical protein
VKKKGLPVPGTGRKSPAALRSKTGTEDPGKPAGVMGASRILPHRYADEGDSGAWFRRLIRRREKAFWQVEADEDCASE